MTSVSDEFVLQWMEAAIWGRQHIGPKHLQAPGPSHEQLLRLFHSAAAAPDHDQLRPWRFIVMGTASRETLAQAFADALLERDAKASPEQLADARAKAYRGPCLILAVADLRNPNPAVPDAEKILSLGCAVQNLLLCAQAQGFATGLTSGKALSHGLFATRSVCCKGSRRCASSVWAHRPSNDSTNPAPIPPISSPGCDHLAGSGGKDDLAACALGAPMCCSISGSVWAMPLWQSMQVLP